MSAMVFKIIFLGTAACLGAVAGWWIRGAGMNSPEPNSPGELPPDPESGEKPQSEAIELMMAKLQQLTATVAADVGEHNCKVQEINDELTAATADGSSVLAVVEKLVMANEVMQSQLMQAESRLNEQAQEIETHVKEARTDALTKLWNRRYFDDEMQNCESELIQSGRPSCLIMLDVDHFKRINDTYGHQAGDEVLKGVARTLRKAAGADTVCRYGGEEFAIILSGADISAAIPIAEKTLAAIAEQVFEFEGLDLKVTASGGLAQMRRDEPLAEVVKRADDALYVCKENGRNCGYWHDGNESHPIKDHAPDLTESEEPPPSSPGELTVQRRDRIRDVSSRTSFQLDVEQRIAAWKQGGATLSVLMVEVDDYDAIIQSYGEKAREVVVRATVQFLKSAMRDMGHISRFEDHLFGILLPDAGEPETRSFAERLRTAISRCSLPLRGDKVTFTVSVGSAGVKQDDTEQSLIARANASLNANKKARVHGIIDTSVPGEIPSMAINS